MTDELQVAVAADGVGWLTLANPGKLNAISTAMWQQLSDALTRFEGDPAVRCIVLRGQGDKAFCVGADISQLGTYSSEQSAMDDYDRIVKGTLNQLQAFPRPSMAMIHGFCIGAGVALATACDLRVASSAARFCVPVAKLGIAYVFEGIQRLVALMGPAQAKRLLYTGEKFSADDMARAGLVDELVMADELEGRVRALAGAIAANAPLSTAATKFGIALACGAASPGDLAAYNGRVRACIASDDHAEGQRAFIEKRLPAFRGC